MESKKLALLCYSLLKKTTRRLFEYGKKLDNSGCLEE
jgi:hypothetical protein